MEENPMPAVERAMKVQAVILKAISGQLQWWQAADPVRMTLIIMPFQNLASATSGWL